LLLAYRLVEGICLRLDFLIEKKKKEEKKQKKK